MKPEIRFASILGQMGLPGCSFGPATPLLPCSHPLGMHEKGVAVITTHHRPWQMVQVCVGRTHGSRGVLAGYGRSPEFPRLPADRRSIQHPCELGHRQSIATTPRNSSVGSHCRRKYSCISNQISSRDKFCSSC